MPVDDTKEAFDMPRPLAFERSSATTLSEMNKSKKIINSIPLSFFENCSKFNDPKVII